LFKIPEDGCDLYSRRTYKKLKRGENSFISGYSSVATAVGRCGKLYEKGLQRLTDCREGQVKIGIPLLNEGRTVGKAGN